MALFPEVKLAGKILGDMISHDICGLFIVLPRIKMELEWVFIFSIVIMVCEPDGRIFGESIVEAYEEISFTKDIGVIDNHYCCFTEGTASAGDWILSIIEFF